MPVPSRSAPPFFAIALLLSQHASVAVETRDGAERFDVIVRNGTLVDGTGAAKRSADVGIRGDHISAVGDLANAAAILEIDARGMYVAPGFINLHSHAMPGAVAHAQNMIRQGVTTEIINADGQSELNIAKQLQTFAKSGLAENLGAYVGFNSVWASVMGEADHRPTPRQIESMRKLVAANLELGAFGVSGGLDYRPAYFAQTKEVVSVLSVAGPWRTNFPNHERLKPELGYSSRAGIAETIRIGRAAGIAPEITHIKLQGHEQGRSGEVIAMMSAATAAGFFTPSDVYPYLAGQTGLADFFVPLWAQDGGETAMLARFKNTQTRQRIVAEAERAMDARFGGPAGVYLYESRRDLTEVMREMHASAGEAVLRLVEQRPSTGAILRFGAEQDLMAFLRYPDTAIACDCGADPEPRTHPRYFGAFPRVLGHYVRETGTLTWEEAIRKMTGLPASISGLVDRGFIAPGMLADIAVFDPATVIDHATYEQPTLPPDGIRDVLVNGRPVLLDSKLTGEQPGRTLARKSNMPTRRMATGLALRMSFNGEVNPPGNVRIEFEATQAPGAAARGKFRLVDAAARVTLDTSTFGFMQAAGGWSSLTAVVQTSRGERNLIVTLDRNDPLDARRRDTLTVAIPGEYSLDRIPISTP